MSRRVSQYLFLLITVAATSKAELVDRVEAIVNKSPIFRSDMDQFRSLIPLRAKIDPLFSSEPLSRKAKPTDADILNFLIDESIIMSKFPVTDAEVEQEISGIQNNFKIDRETLKAAMLREGFSFEDYFKMMRISVAKKQLISREINNKAAVSDDDVKAEYNRARAGLKSFRGTFQISLIRITKSNYKTASAAREEGLHALEEIKAGKSFEEVAKAYSNDPSLESGGDLGFLSYSEMSPLLQREVQKLGPGRISGLIEDKSDFLVVRVGEVRADVDEDFEREKESIRARLKNAELQHQVRIWLDRERSVNFVKVNQK
jgi:peptidyl-prolyl cis-trans isomerase SurA